MGVGLSTIRKTIINYLLRIKGRQSENRPPQKAVRFQLSYKQINASSSLVEKKKKGCLRLDPKTQMTSIFKQQKMLTIKSCDTNRETDMQDVFEQRKTFCSQEKFKARARVCFWSFFFFLRK